jgi:hypothetical protein
MSQIMRHHGEALIRKRRLAPIPCTTIQPTEEPCLTPNPWATHLGDCFCDDNLNNEIYNYDEGDCCLTNPGSFCIECECKQEVIPQAKCMVSLPPVQTTTYPMPYMPYTPYMPDYSADTWGDDNIIFRSFQSLTQPILVIFVNSSTILTSHWLAL